MKVKVIIIGFGYSDDKIPSTLFDVYQVYNKYSKMGYDCEILTDINDFRYNRNVYESISFKKVGREMLSFISDLKKKPNYYNYIFNISGMTEKIRSIGKHDIVIAYYTGHGHSKGIKMPSGETFGFDDFKSLLINSSKEEIYMIIDCCHASGMKLNYQLNKNDKGKFVHIETINSVDSSSESDEEKQQEDVEIIDLSTSLVRTRLEKTNLNQEKFMLQQEHFKEGNNYKQQAIIIASSQQHEKAAAIKHTSLFTKYFIEFLDHYDTRLFSSMVSYIDDNLYSYSSNKQQVNVYSSKMIIPMVATYMFVPRYIRINYRHSYLELINIDTSFSKEGNNDRDNQTIE